MSASPNRLQRHPASNIRPHTRERSEEIHNFPEWLAVRPRPGIAACCLRNRISLRRGSLRQFRRITWCTSDEMRSQYDEYRGRRSIMADQTNTSGERMDERSGSSGGGGSGGGVSGGRNDGGADSRITGSVTRKTPRGFAAMDPQAQRAIAAKGGRAAHQKGTAHEFTSEEARVAGRKGGEASRGGRRSTTSSDNNT